MNLASRMSPPAGYGFAMQTQIHLLVLPYPARGHNLASIQLARKFVPHGVRITVANIFSNMSAELLDICKAEGFAVANLGIRPDHPGFANLPFLGHVESVQGETERFVSSQSPSVTCIISDIFLGWAQVSWSIRACSMIGFCSDVVFQLPDPSVQSSGN